MNAFIHLLTKPTFRIRKAISYCFIGFFAAIALACQSPKQDVAPVSTGSTIDASVSLQWMDLFLLVDRYAPGYRPPVAARALAYIGLAAYETVVPGSANYQSVAYKFSGLSIPKPEAGKTYQWDVALNESYYLMMKGFFPHVSDKDKAKIDSLHTKLAVGTGSSDDISRSKKFGQDVATAVIAYAKTDVAGDGAYLRNQPADYVPPTGPGKWQPTAPDYSRALLPYWGKVRTFVASETDKIAKEPLNYSTNIKSTLFAQGLEIYTATTPLTNDEKWIGEFWSDDIYQLTFEPAARWIAVASEVIRKDKVPLDKAVYTFAKVGMGLSDVGVACWNSKYIYNVERPITYIQRTIDPTWRTRLNNPISIMVGVTPPFPAYPSGHSCFGAAAAEVLTDIYGASYAMTDRCHEGRTEFNGAPRSFNSFYEMAQENAYSRVLLGVHYRMDCEEGLRMGYAIGRKVNQLPWTK
ncbi:MULTISPECIES: vanadium-dependent haloperoxidase [unclassified Spirosoma]|uniref:vanadium-dependent haloperoxidase n=1 Tax=unclassified Spirosoma TaxID=2621999 RepID=UPI000AF64EAF|nr:MULTISPECIES: vanadium-dependent haloperoxidase [unclassified Spirosoma]MBN8824212.1 vanadium-dependent haloperoxidase [Spirosoma sp.]